MACWEGVINFWQKCFDGMACIVTWLVEKGKHEWLTLDLPKQGYV